MENAGLGQGSLEGAIVGVSLATMRAITE